MQSAPDNFDGSSPPMYTEYKVLIVDDEPAARRGIRVRLRAYSDFSIVADCENGVTALEAMRRHAPDLVFLDVRTQGMNAFEMLKRLPANRQPFLIFHTVNDQFALYAFGVLTLRNSSAFTARQSFRCPEFATCKRCPIVTSACA